MRFWVEEVQFGRADTGMSPALCFRPENGQVDELQASHIVAELERAGVKVVQIAGYGPGYYAAELHKR